jgi:hypothetical protein
VAVQGLPLGLFEEHRAGDIGGLAAEFGPMHDAPGDHQIDGEARLQAVGIKDRNFNPMTPLRSDDGPGRGGFGGIADPVQWGEREKKSPRWRRLSGWASFGGREAMLEPQPAVGPVRALPADGLIELEFRGRLRELVPERARFDPRVVRLGWAAGGCDPRRARRLADRLQDAVDGLALGDERGLRQEVACMSCSRKERQGTTCSVR